jgi:hypothetical protein
MPAVSHLAEDLRETNSRLHFWLDSMMPSAQRVPAARQMAGVLSELMRAGAWLRQLPEEREPALADELTAYRKNVERLREMLPTIHRALLEERSRLETERARVGSAAEWARRSRETL